MGSYPPSNKVLSVTCPAIYRLERGRIAEKLPAEGREHAGLKSETVQFARRVAQSVLDLSMSRGCKL
jgi:hypothetical protein